MNCKRLILSIIATFIFVYAYDSVLHGLLLADIYERTSDLWRSKEGMQQYFYYIIISQIALTIAVVYMFARYGRSNTAREGARFGLHVGLILGAMHIATYGFMPIPLELMIYWVIGSIVEATGMGIVAGLVYKPKTDF